jgi:putative endonuclease
VGYTNDMLRRFAEHKTHTDPDRFTSRYTFDRIVHVEVFPSEELAAKRERQIKGWIRKKKVALIEKDNPWWHDLSPRLRDYRLD